jgi:C1A family cysteine protease
MSIMVNPENWHLYSPNENGGVMTASTCGSSAFESSTHGAQLVGYNTQVTPPYWIVRNSFATDWGVDGYIYLEMGSSVNTCGLGNEVTYVTLETK